MWTTLRYGELPDIVVPEGNGKPDERFKVVWLHADGHLETYVGGEGGLARRRFERGKTTTDVIGGYLADSGQIRGSFGELAETH